MIDTGFEFSGYYIEQWATHEIDTSNTVNGDPVYYWKNQNGGTIPTGTGQVILANCTNVIVENQDISESYIGIILGFSYNNLIRNNNASSNTENGLYIFSSNNNTIEDNIFIDTGEGIYFSRSNGNNIAGNYISENGGGMIFGGSDGNNITDNIFQYNLFGLMLVLSNRNYINNNNFSYNWASAGIHISSSSNNSIFNNMLFENKEGINITDFFYNSGYNKFFHNSLIGNTNQAYDDTIYENYWDNGYPSGGNYWDDYSGLDTKNGPNQDITGGDGIGDSPYEIELDSRDNYPLMEPWGTDTTPPSIELISPLDESFIDIGTIINLSISDINLDEVTFSINNGGNEILTSPYIIETSDWLDGDYTVEVQASDTSDNVKTVVYHFYVDTIPPTISLDSPRNNSMINADSLIEFTISDDNIEDVTYRINGGISIPLSHPFIINPSDWSEGDNTITILAVDKAGNTNERWYRFTLDRSAPQIILNSPENGSFIKDLSLDFDISDDNLDSVQYKKNQDTFIDFEVPYDLDITFWEDGEYTITIKVSDLAGNTMENWFIFQKDTTSPEIVSIYPEDDSMDVGVNEKIVIEFSEPMDLQSVESAISISPYSEYSCAWRSDNTSLTLSFSESLEYQTQYKLTIGSASQDLASNTMDSKSEHEFTTVEQSENGIAEFPLFNFILLILIILTIVGLFVMVVLLIKRKKNIQKTSEVGPQFQDQSMEIACHQCGYYFMVNKTYGPMQVQCPNCGTQGTLR
jgi:parallel beta-helix repeat protein